MQGLVLVVDDDRAVAKVLGALLRQAGLTVESAENGREAIEKLAGRPYDLVLSDLRMPELDGMALLKHVKAKTPGLPVILLTAHGSVPTAVEAMRHGAQDFLLKPFEKDEILFVVGKALAATSDQGPDSTPAEELVLDSPAMSEVYARIARAAPTNTTVLLLGETGTGKDVLARRLHHLSQRNAGPFVAVNCGALSEGLLESELFGHERGAFTGAVSSKPGRVELADGGTLFLDEVGDMPAPMQVKLLRVLEAREVQRVGGIDSKKIDVRFVCATHRDLEKAVSEGTFREDLYYRIGVLPVKVPALRERPADIEKLAAHFAQSIRASRPDAAQLTEEATRALAKHSFPGNVRELRNIVERLLVLSETGRVVATDVERELGRPSLSQILSQPTKVGATLENQRAGAEKEAVLRALVEAHDNRSLAAKLLGISRRTLYNKLREHQIE